MARKENVINLDLQIPLNSFFGGLGLRPDHYSYLGEKTPVCAKWFEAISENYMDSEGQPLDKLLSIRDKFPVALHGVSMGIGGPDPIDKTYLTRLKKLIGKTQPFIVSDHLCWSGLGGHSAHDLLPLPYTHETLERIVAKLDVVQNFLGQEILLENPSSYIQFTEADFSEPQFLAEVARRSGCGVLLDLNNVFVSCQNFKWDCRQYLSEIPPAVVGQIHLAGFSKMPDFLFDTHSTQVSDPVWTLYREFIQGLNTIPVMIEWDQDIPEFTIYEAELMKAQNLWKEAHGIPLQSEVSAIL